MTKEEQIEYLLSLPSNIVDTIAFVRTSGVSKDIQRRMLDALLESVRNG
jgi:hypothetical protein